MTNPPSFVHTISITSRTLFLFAKLESRKYDRHVMYYNNVFNHFKREIYLLYFSVAIDTKRIHKHSMYIHAY